MKIMRKLVLVPLEEWQKMKPDQQKTTRGEDKKIINVAQMEKSPKKEEKWQPQMTVDPPQVSPFPPAAAAAATTAATNQTAAVKTKKEKKPGGRIKMRTMKKIKEDIKEEKFPDNRVSQPLLRIEHFSPSYRKNAAKLLKYLRKSKKVAYNNKLEVIYMGKVLENSNIIDLIEHALSRRNRNAIPAMTRFYRILKIVNVPIDLVKNPLGKIVMNKKSDK